MAAESNGKIARDERKETVVAWIIVVLLVGSMFFRALLSIWLYGIGTPTRHWQYRTVPQTPAQAYSSTRPASSSTQVEKQVPLPPAQAKRAKGATK